MIYFLAPARDSAPAGSAMTLVSSYRSLIAEQISSVVTVIDESTIFFVNLNVFEPIFFTATPSAKIPTCFNEVGFPFLYAKLKQAESSASTATIFIFGFIVLR